jgi:hypothetical protein
MPFCWRKSTQTAYTSTQHREVPERLNGAVSKTVIGAILSRVRIPPSLQRTLRWCTMRLFHKSISHASVLFFAQMAELADALYSGCSVRMDVQVRLLFWAHKFSASRMITPAAFFCAIFSRIAHRPSRIAHRPSFSRALLASQTTIHSHHNRLHTS